MFSTTKHVLEFKLLLFLSNGIFVCFIFLKVIGNGPNDLKLSW